MFSEVGALFAYFLMMDLAPYQPPLPLSFEDRIRDRALEYLDAAQAPDTKRRYASAWSDFLFFCESHRLQALPAGASTVGAYLTFLAPEQSVSTLRVKLSAIADQHRRVGYPNPTLDPRVRELLRGIRRKHGTPPQQKAAIARPELFAILQALDEDIAAGKISVLRGTRNKAMFVLTYAGAFRRGEVAALDIGHLKFTPTEMIVTVQRSKTDQEGQGFKKHIPRLDTGAQHAAICPVRLVRLWLRLAQIKDGPLFRAIDRYDHVRRGRMAARDLADFLKKAAERADLNPEEIGAHSLRSGPVTQGLEDGFAEWEMMAVTGQKSRTTLQRYNRKQASAQVRVVKGLFGQESAAE